MVRCIGCNRYSPKIWAWQVAPHPNSVVMVARARGPKDLKLTKVIGTANPADMLTKHLAEPDLDKHIEFSCLTRCIGRAGGSLHVSAFSRPSCSTRGGVVDTAIRSAAGSFYMMGSSKVGMCPLQPRGVHNSISERTVGG